MILKLLLVANQALLYKAFDPVFFITVLIYPYRPPMNGVLAHILILHQQRPHEIMSIVFVSML